MTPFSRHFGFAAIVAGCAAWAVAAHAAEPVGPSDVAFSEDLTVDTSLTGAAGDAAAGRDWFAARKLGNCLACHVNSEMSELPFHGEVAPSLDGVGARWSEAELRAIVVNSKTVFGPDTMMPAFYSLEVGHRTLDTFEGKTILTAEQVEDVVAYLLTLTEE